MACVGRNLGQRVDAAISDFITKLRNAKPPSDGLKRWNEVDVTAYERAKGMRRGSLRMLIGK